VPMLWRTLCYADLPLAELVARAVDGGTQGVMHVPPEHPRPPPAASPARHGPVEHHHQQ
jgi:PTS system mannose-specific IIA component